MVNMKKSGTKKLIITLVIVVVIILIIISGTIYFYISNAKTNSQVPVDKNASTGSNGKVSVVLNPPNEVYVPVPN